VGKRSNPSELCIMQSLALQSHQYKSIRRQEKSCVATCLRVWLWVFNPSYHLRRVGFDVVAAFNRLQDITVPSCPSAISSRYIECALGFHGVSHASFHCACIQLLFRCLVQTTSDDCTARRGIIVFCLNKHSWLHCKIKSHFEQEVDERISVKWALVVDGKARLVTTEVYFFHFLLLLLFVFLC
jgi:hypothetical protein